MFYFYMWLVFRFKHIYKFISNKPKEKKNKNCVYVSIERFMLEKYDLLHSSKSITNKLQLHDKHKKHIKVNNYDYRVI